MAVIRPDPEQWRGYDDFPHETTIQVPGHISYWGHQRELTLWCWVNLGKQWSSWTLRGYHLARRAVISTVDPDHTVLVRLTWM